MLMEGTLFIHRVWLLGMGSCAVVVIARRAVAAAATAAGHRAPHAVVLAGRVGGGMLTQRRLLRVQATVGTGTVVAALPAT